MNKNFAKAIVASVGIISVSLVTYLLKQPNCLWALMLVYWLLDKLD